DSVGNNPVFTVCSGEINICKYFVLSERKVDLGGNTGRRRVNNIHRLSKKIILALILHKPGICSQRIITFGQSLIQTYISIKAPQTVGTQHDSVNNLS